MAAFDYEWLKKSVYDLTKIDLNAYKERQMKRRIDTLIERNGIVGYDKYIQLLKTDRNKFEEFVNYLTINVSEFYRNPDQWVFLEKEVFPQLIEKFGKNLKIWSAACSTGDEPYSLAMCLSKFIPLNQIHITATDIDKQVMAQAKTGLYDEKSIAGVPAEYKKKYFTQIGKSYQISDEIKRCVTFQQHNLLKDKYFENYHLIVCRNVVIYFTEEAKAEIYKKFAGSLVKGGMLFIDNGGGNFGQAVRQLVSRIFPDKPFIDIPNDDPIYQRPYSFPDGAPPFWHHDGTRAKGVRVGDRLAVFYHPGDINDAWKDGHSGASEEVAEQAYRLGINVMYYAFNAYYARHFEGSTEKR